jgi:hypothetical protein
VHIPQKNCAFPNSLAANLFSVLCGLVVAAENSAEGNGYILGEEGTVLLKEW